MQLRQIRWPNRVLGSASLELPSYLRSYKLNYSIQSLQWPGADDGFLVVAFRNGSDISDLEPMLVRKQDSTVTRSWIWLGTKMRLRLRQVRWGEPWMAFGRAIRTKYRCYEGLGVLRASTRNNTNG